MRPNKPMPVTNTVHRSLFKHVDHYLKADRLLDGILQGRVGSLRVDEEGRVPLDKVLDVLCDENKALGYVDFEHLVELYLRQTPAYFLLDGDDIVSLKPSDCGKPSEPPDTLYFGTVQGVATRALEQGLQSLKHPHVVLTSDIDSATRRAVQFAESTSDDPVLLKIDASQAHECGVEFVVGNRKGLYMATHISRRYITSETL